MAFLCFIAINTRLEFQNSKFSLLTVFSQMIQLFSAFPELKCLALW